MITIHYTGWAKSRCANVGLNRSVTECSIQIILFGMTYYHYWFEEFVKSKNIRVHFFQMKVHFRIFLNSLDSWIKLHFIEVCLAIRITFAL